MEWLEVAGVAVGFIYLWLEYKASVWLWAASVAMPLLYLDVYWQAGLYADFGINVYYLLASVYGFARWRFKRGTSDRPAAISRTPRGMWKWLCLATAALWLLTGWILWRYTDSTVPWSDGLTTALSITALWMLAQKYAEQWLLWLAADVGCSVLYVYKGLYFTAVLYGVYAVVAVAGYRKWLKMLRNGHDI